MSLHEACAPLTVTRVHKKIIRLVEFVSPWVGSVLKSSISLTKCFNILPFFGSPGTIIEKSSKLRYIVSKRKKQMYPTNANIPFYKTHLQSC